MKTLALFFKPSPVSYSLNLTRSISSISSGGMLDVNLFRVEKGNDPERIRESQRRRSASVEVVDEVIALDKAWRQRQFELDNLRKDFNKLTKEIARLKIVSFIFCSPLSPSLGFVY